MTIYNWQRGTPTRDPLPAERDGRKVGYPVAKIRKWAEKHNLQLLADPDVLVGTGILRPGPKPRLVVDNTATKPRKVTAEQGTPLKLRTKSG